VAQDCVQWLVLVTMTNRSVKQMQVIYWPTARAYALLKQTLYYGITTDKLHILSK